VAREPRCPKGPASGRLEAGERTPTDSPGSHGPRGAGGSGEGEARGAHRSSSPGPGRRCPPVRPSGPLLAPPTTTSSALHSSSPAPAARIRGWHQPPALPPCFQPPRRNLGQGRREQTHTLALPRAAPKTSQDGGASGWRGPSRTNTSHKFYFPFALQVLWLSFASRPHVLRGSPPFPSRGTDPCRERLFWNSEKLTRLLGRDRASALIIQRFKNII
jgi:hypothetical protein